MTKQLTLVTILGGLVLAPLATADTKADKPAPPPAVDIKKMASTPADELAAMKFLVGSWHCEGTTTPPPGVGKQFASKGNITWAFALDGFWLGGTSEGEKVPGQPLPTVWKGESRITYDRTAKQFVNIGIGNRGAYALSTAKGFEGDKLTWAGSTTGLVKAETRTAVTKKGDKEYRVLAERMENGKWVTGSDETCKKK